MQSENAQLLIQQPEADIQMHQEPIRVEINRTSPQLKIDQTKAWSALGEKSALELTSTIAKESYRLSLEGIARRARQGDRLGDLRIKTNPIPDIARENFYLKSNIRYADPVSPDLVEIRFIPGELNIEWFGGTVDRKVKANQPLIDYLPGALDIYLREKNSIEIIVPKIDQRL